jgi:hypothetical protein
MTRDGCSSRRSSTTGTALAAHGIDVVIDMEGGLDACIPTKPGTCLYVYFPIFDEACPIRRGSKRSR